MYTMSCSKSMLMSIYYIIKGIQGIDLSKQKYLIFKRSKQENNFNVYGSQYLKNDYPKYITSIPVENILKYSDDFDEDVKEITVQTELFKYRLDDVWCYLNKISCITDDCGDDHIELFSRSTTMSKYPAMVEVLLPATTKARVDWVVDKTNDSVRRMLSEPYYKQRFLSQGAFALRVHMLNGSPVLSALDEKYAPVGFYYGKDKQCGGMYSKLIDCLIDYSETFKSDKGVGEIYVFLKGDLTSVRTKKMKNGELRLVIM